MLLDNNTVDYWFKDIKKYLNKLDYDKHNLNIEILKNRLLNNQTHCFLFNDLLIIGNEINGYKRELLIEFISGNISDNINNAIYYIRDLGFSRISGNSSKYFNRLIKKYLPSVEHKYIYEIDVSELQGWMDNNPTNLIPATHLDYWFNYENLKFNKVKDNNAFDFYKSLQFQLSKKEIFCYNIKKCGIIGYTTIGVRHKYFFCLYAFGENLEEDMRIFCDFLGKNNIRYAAFMCDEIRTRIYDRYIRKFIKNGFYKKQICNFFSLTEVI